MPIAELWLGGRDRLNSDAWDGIQVTVITVMDGHTYRTLASGVHYDSAMIKDHASQSWANYHAKNATQYLDSLTRAEVEGLSPNVLMHPDLRDALLAAFEKETKMTINLNWTPTLNACPDCGDEHDCVARVECPVCNYHCGGDLSQQWFDYCEALVIPAGLTLDFCHEAEGGNDYYLDVTGSPDAVRVFATALGGTVGQDVIRVGVEVSK